MVNDIVIFERFENLAKEGKINLEFYYEKKRPKLLKLANEEKARIKEREAKAIKDSKGRVSTIIESGKKLHRLNKEIGFVGIKYINGKLKEYGYEPTFWSEHERNTNGKVSVVKEHYKSIIRVINKK